MHFHKWAKWETVFRNSFGGVSVQERDCEKCGQVVRRFV